MQTKIQTKIVDNIKPKTDVEVDVIDSVSFVDALAFAEYFRDHFNYYDCTSNGSVYKHKLHNRGHAMTMEQIFVEWKAKEKMYYTSDEISKKYDALSLEEKNEVLYEATARRAIRDYDKMFKEGR